MSNVFTGKYWTIDRFISGFANNAFLITCARTGSSVIIDTPADPHELIKVASRTTVGTILITHGHRDHVEGYENVIEKFPVPTGIGALDREALPETAPFSVSIETRILVRVGDITLKSLFTPGHTPGSTCYVLESDASKSEGEPTHVFTGDTLFPGGPGKSSSNKALRKIIDSLETHIFNLPENSVVLPGHGEFTTIGESKREFRQFSSKPLDPDLYGDVTWASI